MAQRFILYWRDIPAQVVVKRGRVSEKRELQARFMLAVDAAAMQAGLRESDAYLGEWRRGPAEECGEDLAAEADAACAALDAAYDPARLAALVRNGGAVP